MISALKANQKRHKARYLQNVFLILKGFSVTVKNFGLFWWNEEEMILRQLIKHFDSFCFLFFFFVNISFTLKLCYTMKMCAIFL